MTPEKALKAMAKCPYWNGRKSLSGRKPMLHLDEKQRRFLSELVARGGSATSKDLGGYTVDGANARRMCSLRRLAKYEGVASHSGIWSITDDGRKALEQESAPSMDTSQNNAEMLPQREPAGDGADTIQPDTGSVT